MLPFRFLPLFLLALAASGCTSFELTRVRNDLARQLPEAEIGDGYSIAFGGVSVGLARWLAGFGDDGDGEIAQVALREVRRVQFGRYDVEGTVDASRLTMPARLQDYVDEGAWTHLASFREDGEAGWVLYRDHDDTITDLFAVVLSDEELVLARLSGDLNALVLNVLQHQRLLEAAEPDEEDAETESGA